MNVEIINKNFTLNIYGFSGIAVSKDYTKTAFQLMDKMWQTVKAKELNHKGINVWIYEPNEKVFAGVELHYLPDYDTGLEHKAINLIKYAYYKHVGPYDLLKHAGQNMRDEIKNQGFKVCFPYVEIYGHWTNDETKLETELLMSLK